MTESEKKEARSLLHYLWGAHASGDYEKPEHKPKWARLDVLLGLVVPTPLPELPRSPG